MKNNQLTAILVALVFLSTLASLGLVVKYNLSIRTVQHLGPELPIATTEQNVMGGLFHDAAEYQQATKNADMLRILESVPGVQMTKTSPK